MINLTIKNNYMQFGGGVKQWCGKWKCIHAHVFMYICFLVGASNPFTFKVLIHVYDPITVFLIVLDLFSVDLFLLLCFLPREVPSALVVKLVSVQFSSLPQSCLTLCDPMDSSMPGFPVHRQLLELAQTLVHRVSDAIQPSHPLSSPSTPVFNLSQCGAEFS